MTTIRARTDLHRSVQWEAVRILHDLLDHVHGVRPMPDGTNLFILDLSAAQVDRLAVWGAEVEDLEDSLDADLEDDARDLPKARGALAPVFSASLLLPPEPIPAGAEIAAVKPLPRELRELAERIAA